ncbi:MAG: BlaI/MecI/CopY family transcriptional regulator [Candidatus Aenigmarchaeota archaeon]|nr:BlaI/MecI/CopY family transcriptional regulator [Candidatus Aenigmarchaeota archaeon]
MVNVDKVRFNRSGYEAVLSPLENSILEALWEKKKAKVRELHAHLKPRKDIALTSIAVGLDRLHKKGIVSREVENGQGGAHYIYYPCTSKQEFEKSVLESITNKLIYNFGDIAVNYFNERFAEPRPKRGRG